MLNVPQGLTQKNVNSKIFALVNAHWNPSQNLEILDLPCGEGLWANFLSDHFPKAHITGVDFQKRIGDFKFDFVQSSALDFFRKHNSKKFDLITCISGIMCFDGLDELIPHFNHTLNSRGLLVITNDNVMTVRDRLHFLFFGSFKRFKLRFQNNEGNWNLVLPQALKMKLEGAGFKVERVEYTSFYLEDLLFLPLALVIYPIFVLGFLMKQSSWDSKTTFMYFPFSHLLCRHYIILAKKV